MYKSYVTYSVFADRESSLFYLRNVDGFAIL